MTAFSTRLMRFMAKNYKPSSDIVCVDSTGGVDRKGYRVFAFVVPFVTGAIPLCIGICQDEKMDTLSKLFGMMGQCLPGYNPSCIMTDDSAAERGALAFVFPNSRLLLCQFHVSAVI